MHRLPSVMMVQGRNSPLRVTWAAVLPYTQGMQDLAVQQPSEFENSKSIVHENNHSFDSSPSFSINLG